MRSFRIPLFIVALVSLVAACSPAEPAGTSTTLGSTSTTAPPTTTTSAAPTTTQPSDVTVDPNLPAAQPRTAIPWDEVGPGWHVLMYDSSKAWPEDSDDAREGPRVLYLADDSGSLFEIASWEPDSYPYLVDATASSALVVSTASDPDQTIYEHVDLHTGTKSVVHSAGFDETQYINVWPLASLTRPSGDNTVVYRADAGSDWIERRSPDGSVLSNVWERSRSEDQSPLTWLYGPDGTSLIVGDHDTLQIVGIGGGLMTGLWVPPDTQCQPVRWWDAGTILARCNQTNPDTALVDTDGNPHLHYDWLWLIPTNGSEGTEVSSIPDEPTIVVDFGHRDAWPVGDGVLLQWTGDCGAAEVRTAEGFGNGLPAEWPEELVGFSSTLLDVRDDIVTLFVWESCGGTIGFLATTDLDGETLDVLVPVIGDANGVTGVVSLTTIYP